MPFDSKRRSADAGGSAERVAAIGPGRPEFRSVEHGQIWPTYPSDRIYGRSKARAMLGVWII
jgi:hypothetical protein